MSKSDPVSLARLRHAIVVIETSTWSRISERWGEREEWRGDDDRRDEVLRDLKLIYHQLGGPKL